MPVPTSGSTSSKSPPTTTGSNLAATRSQGHPNGSEAPRNQDPMKLPQHKAEVRVYQKKKYFVWFFFRFIEHSRILRHNKKLHILHLHLHRTHHLMFQVVISIWVI